MRRVVVSLGFLLLGCESKPVPTPAHRVELRQLSGNLVELIPKEGSPPRCLAFSVAERGVVRQLTMSEENESLDCPPGQPIGGASFRIPKVEGNVRIYVLFSDDKLRATSVADQMSDLAASPSFSVLDLRLPGKVVSDVLDYRP